MTRSPESAAAEASVGHPGAFGPLCGQGYHGASPHVAPRCQHLARIGRKFVGRERGRKCPSQSQAWQLYRLNLVQEAPRAQHATPVPFDIGAPVVARVRPEVAMDALAIQSQSDKAMPNVTLVPLFPLLQNP
eukprot:CAMPEP_0172907018 /NCGR_PEP_ID=MMETSP1075-20121228/177983_1 /TAXON_ID=2916 /ORGANISM="Ceratium fusus, Strain PA161109" /LENGTH=131 /DNA_ID=CAMNT_0013764557 /DNA_START=65 /DNA_END=461 /DNA_ORIENTATION=+